MDSAMVLGVLYAAAPVVFLLLIVLSRRARRHGGTLRAGVVGAMYEWQDRDKQKALDVIVEGKAAERHPEYPDGDLPQLESARKKRPGSRDGDEENDGEATQGPAGKPTC